MCPRSGHSNVVSLPVPVLAPLLLLRFKIQLAPLLLLLLLPDPSLSSPCRWGGTQHRPEPLREPFVGRGGGGTQPCGLKVSERLFWRGAGEEGEPAPPLPGSRLGGRHEISQQIMKLSLIAGESEGRRGVWRLGGGGYLVFNTLVPVFIAFGENHGRSLGTKPSHGLLDIGSPPLQVVLQH